MYAMQAPQPKQVIEIEPMQQQVLQGRHQEQTQHNSAAAAAFIADLYVSYIATNGPPTATDTSNLLGSQGGPDLVHQPTTTQSLDVETGILPSSKTLKTLETIHAPLGLHQR